MFSRASHTSARSNWICSAGAFLGGRWHIIQTSAQVSIQENHSHCLIQSKFDMRCEATSHARTLCSGPSGAKCFRFSGNFSCAPNLFFLEAAGPVEIWATNFLAPKRTNLALQILHPRNSFWVFSLVRNFQSRMKISILTFRTPSKNRGLVGGSLEMFNLAWEFQSRRRSWFFFNLWALS